MDPPGRATDRRRGRSTAERSGEPSLSDPLPCLVTAGIHGPAGNGPGVPAGRLRCRFLQGERRRGRLGPREESLTSRRLDKLANNFTMQSMFDLRFAVRLLARDRGFTAAATLALALGIGMNAMVFTLVNALLLRSLPFEDADRIMYVGERDRVSGRTFMVSWPDFQDWRDSQRSF